jgi:putative transposase
MGKPGPKGPSREVIDAIVAMKERNPRFGCPRIAQQMNLAFGLDLDKDVVRRILAIHYRPDPGGTGPSWLTTIGHAKDSLWSIDFFRCEPILLRSHWVLVVMDQHTRRIIGFGLHKGDVDGPALCRMFNGAVAKQHLPCYVSSDNDPLFLYHRWQANLRILEIEEIKTVPHVPISHPFVERLIGSIRRELLDQVFFWTAADLERKLSDYQCYYNQSRTHSSINGATPAEENERQVIDINDYRWQRHCRGLMELPIAA